MSLTRFLPMLVFSALTLSACADTSTTPATTASSTTTGAGSASTTTAPGANTDGTPKGYMEVRNVQFPIDEGTFPQVKGYDKFAASCTICHSKRYIEMQPNFTKVAWAKVVHKMITTYGAPISDTDAAEIVEYLATIKGKPQAQ